MNWYEVRRADNSLSARVVAESEEDAAELADFGGECYVYPVDETTPIGFEGGDAEDALP